MKIHTQPMHCSQGELSSSLAKCGGKKTTCCFKENPEERCTLTGPRQATLLPFQTVGGKPSSHPCLLYQAPPKQDKTLHARLSPFPSLSLQSSAGSYIWVVTANHLPIGDLVAEAVSRLIGIHRHVQYI